MNTCQVCHKELDEGAVARGDAILAKGQPVCASCAEHLGIPADPPMVLPQPRSPTESIPLPTPPPPAPGRGAGIAVAVGLLALGGAGWTFWQSRLIQEEVGVLRAKAETPPPGPSASDVRKELAARLGEAEAKLAEFNRIVAALKEQEDRQAAAHRELAALAAALKDEAKRAREEGEAARKASEEARRALPGEVAAAVDKALAERAAVSRAEAGPAAPSPAAEAVSAMAEQYWTSAQGRSRDLAREGRFAPALHEYERIPRKYRRPDYDQRLEELKADYEKQALERTDLVLKALEPRLASGDYAYAEELLAQVVQDCDFPAVLDKLKPKLDELRTLQKAQVRQEGRTAGHDAARLVRSLIDDLGQDDPKVQRRAVDALKSLGADAVPALVQALEDPKPAARWGALMALAGIKSPDAAPAVAKRLEDSDPKVRLTAADILAEFDDLRAVEPLIEALSDKDTKVAKQAEVTLEQLTHFVPPNASEKPAENAPAWRAWWEAGRKKATAP